MIKGYILDMDGTLLDSMYIWENAATTLLLKKGIVADDEIKNILAPLSINEAIKYLKNRYSFIESVTEIQNELIKILEYQYLNDVILKPGAQDFIKNCVYAKKKLCLLTANKRNLTVEILTKHNIINYFDEIITCDDTTLTKQDGAIYRFAAQQLNLNIDECIVIEDAFHAICVAKKAGFIVWGVADESNLQDWPQIKKISDLTFKSMEFMEVV